jgi:hypothetical protein
MRGFTLDLPAQVTAGTLHYQIFLRAFFEDTRLVEAKTVGSMDIDLLGSPTPLECRLGEPLSVEQGGRNTLEIELSWQSRSGASILALNEAPLPLASD